MSAIHTLAIFVATASLAVAGEPRKAIDPASIKDKVTIGFDQAHHVKFKADGHRLLEPKIVQGADDDKDAITLQLVVGGPSPGRVLIVHNRFDGRLQFRVLARLKGSKDFFEVDDDLLSAAPDRSWCHFWPAASAVEEAVLYQFTVSDKASKDKK